MKTEQIANKDSIEKRNKAGGMLLEELISNSCAKYSEDGSAHIEKITGLFQLTEEEKDDIVSECHVKVAQPDFKGNLAGGEKIMFETKHISTNKINQNAIPGKLCETFNIYHDLGVICFVLVSMRFESFYRIPWSVWKNMDELFGHKYMTLEDLQPYKIKKTSDRLFFLDGISIMGDSAAGE